MNANSKLSLAIAAILSGSGLGLGIAHADTATDTADSEGIAEITVTAQRRTESIENVPITIQAVTGDQLKQLNVQNFESLLKYTPNVTYSGNGPGTGNIFMRGLSSGGSGNQSQSTTAPFPNVALYLDDQSMQFPARNNDRVHGRHGTGSKCWKARRAPCSAAARRRVPFATSPTSPSSM